MGVAARWSLLLAAVLGVGYLLLQGGHADRFLPEVAAVLDLELGPGASDGALATGPGGPLPGPSWARVRAGLPSGAARIEPWPKEEFPASAPTDVEVAEERLLGDSEALPAPTDIQAALGAGEPTSQVVRRRVEAGLTLSEILYAHYGRQGPKLASAVARYNGLTSPDKVRAGAELELPSLEVLAPLMR